MWVLDPINRITYQYCRTPTAGAGVCMCVGGGICMSVCVSQHLVGNVPLVVGATNICQASNQERTVYYPHHGHIGLPGVSCLVTHWGPHGNPGILIGVGPVQGAFI